MIDINIKTDYDSLDYPSLKEVCQSCTKCELSQNRTHVVVGSGPVPCNLMVIGEGPGEQEDMKGLPFVGRSGQLLTKMLDSVGIDREKEAFIANIVKCRPPQNRNPLPSEIEACKPYLIRQIQLIKPKIIMLLGSPSLKTILEDQLTITRARGKWVTAKVSYMPELLYIIPTFHPSYLLRTASKEKGSPKWLAWNDMKEVKAALSFYDTEVLEQV